MQQHDSLLDSILSVAYNFHMQTIQELLPFILTPKNLLILLIVFLVVFWLLSFLKSISSLIIKILIAALVVVVVAYYLGVDLLANGAIY
ncbi:hypothetical protein GW793_03800 [bacterium]|nr:hypothetical protein [bacterium]